MNSYKSMMKEYIEGLSEYVKYCEQTYSRWEKEARRIKDPSKKAKKLQRLEQIKNNQYELKVGIGHVKTCCYGLSDYSDLATEMYTIDAVLRQLYTGNEKAPNLWNTFRSDLEKMKKDWDLGAYGGNPFDAVAKTCNKATGFFGTGLISSHCTVGGRSVRITDAVNRLHDLGDKYPLYEIGETHPTEYLSNILVDSSYNDKLAVIDEYEHNSEIPRIDLGIKDKVLEANTGREVINDMIDIERKLAVLNDALSKIDKSGDFTTTRNVIVQEIEKLNEALLKANSDLEKSNFEKIKDNVNERQNKDKKDKKQNDVMERLINHFELELSLDKNSEEYEQEQLAYSKWFEENSKYITDYMIREAQLEAKKNLREKEYKKNAEEFGKQLEAKDKEDKQKEAIANNFVKKPSQQEIDNPYYQRALEDFRKAYDKKVQMDRGIVEHPENEFDVYLSTINMSERQRAEVIYRNRYGDAEADEIKANNPRGFERILDGVVRSMRDAGFGTALDRIGREMPKEESLSDENVTNVFVEVPSKEDVKEQIEVREFVEKPKEEIDFTNWSLEDIERYQQTGELPTPKPQIIENEHSNSL